MHKLVSCYIKWKLRTCPYKRLIQIENEITYFKKARHYLKTQYEELTRQLEQIQALQFNDKKKSYLDGFYWENHEEGLEKFHCFNQINHEIINYRQKCPFSNQDCELQLLAKRSMKHFLSELLIVEVQSYNTVLAIYEAISAYHYKIGSSPTAFIRSSIEKDCSKAFYYDVNANNLMTNAQYTIIYFEKKLQDKVCYQYTLHFKVQKERRALANTCLLNQDEKSIIVELCELMKWIEVGVAFKLKSLYELLSQINVKNHAPINLYGKLEKLPTSEKIACITYFRKQGFRVLGAFKENGYFEEECFIYYAYTL